MGAATAGLLAARPLAGSNAGEPTAATKAVPKDAWIIGIDSALTGLADTLA